MLKKILKIILAILGVIFIGVIVWVVMNRVHYDVVYRSDYVQPSATKEHDIVLSHYVFSKFSGTEPIVLFEVLRKPP